MQSDYSAIAIYFLKISITLYYFLYFFFILSNSSPQFLLFQPSCGSINRCASFIPIFRLHNQRPRGSLSQGLTNFPVVLKCPSKFRGRQQNFHFELVPRLFSFIDRNSRFSRGERERDAIRHRSLRVGLVRVVQRPR